MTTITFERSGGFMGRTVSITIDLDSLPSDQAETLRGLIEQSAFFKREDAPPTSAVPDGFSYTITVAEETRTRTIHTADMAIDPDLQPLIDELSRRMRTR